MSSVPNPHSSFIFQSRWSINQAELSHSLCDPSEVSLYPENEKLLKAADEKKVATFVVSNQSEIARGYFNWSDCERFTAELLKLLGVSAPLARVNINGHETKTPTKSWLKPSHNMDLSASIELNFVQKKSFLVDDHLSGVAAGASGGVWNLINVLAGHEQRASTERDQEVSAKNQESQISYLDTLMDLPISLLR